MSIIALALCPFIAATPPATPSYQLAKLHCGGDWHAKKASRPNLSSFCNQALHANQKAVLLAHHDFWSRAIGSL